MRRRGRGGECPPELVRFRPEDWPAPAEDVALMGPRTASSFNAWIRWIHARTEFAISHHIDESSIPDLTTVTPLTFEEVAHV